MQKYFFGRLAVLFVLAASVLVVLTYYIFNWAVVDKDNILDVHDAYYHYKFIETWGDFSDTTQIREELQNLRIIGTIYYLKADTLCTDDYRWNKDRERQLTYWTNSSQEFSLCDYMSYQGSENLAQIHKVSFPGYVSFGDIQIGSKLFPATIIEKDDYQTLLIITDYVYPNEWVSFAPVVFLLFVFMFFL